MVGLGCGARSYTRGLHYALDYAVAPKGIKAIVADYLARGDDEFGVADLGFATVDLHRRERCGFPEVIFCQGKTCAWVEGVVHQLIGAKQHCLATRVSEVVAIRFPDISTPADATIPCSTFGRRPPPPLQREHRDTRRSGPAAK